MLLDKKIPNDGTTKFNEFLMQLQKVIHYPQNIIHKYYVLWVNTP